MGALARRGDEGRQLLPDNLELVLPGRKRRRGAVYDGLWNSTLGPYGEVGIGIQAVRKGTGATLVGICGTWSRISSTSTGAGSLRAGDSGMHVGRYR